MPQLKFMNLYIDNILHYNRRINIIPYKVQIKYKKNLKKYLMNV